MAYFLLILLAFFAACSGNKADSKGVIGVDPSASAFQITDSSQLIGGPLAHGRVGDLLLENDKIRVIIQQPSKFAQACPFGGVIIDADIVRNGTPGQDNFGKMCPLVNIEWTVNYGTFSVTANGSDGGPKIIRAIGTIDVHDYLDLDFVAPVAKALTGQSMNYSPRYDDANDPFNTYPDLREINAQVITDYILEPGKNYVRIETTYENFGDSNVKMPVGQFVNGSGQVQTLFPGMGFTPAPTGQLAGDTSAIIYVPFEGVDVSYGYFYDVRQFSKQEETAVSAQEALVGSKETQTVTKRQISTSLTYSGVTGVLLGEPFLKVLPLGSGNTEVNFTIPAHGKKTLTEYLFVGDGNAGNVFNSAMDALAITTSTLSGKVVDISGAPVEGATVVIQNENNTTIIIHRTKEDGLFSAKVSTGKDDFAQAFGKGKYRIFVDKPGYNSSKGVAGTCNPENVDASVVGTNDIVCTLGTTGIVTLDGGVKDFDTKYSIPARLTIVGFDPTPDSHAGAAYATTKGPGAFEDTLIFERPWGVVDVKYVNLKGGFGLDNNNSFHLEPGKYAFVFSHGMEYGIEVREVEVSTSGITLSDVKLKRLIKTPGWISADFHLHSIYSPDSNIPAERRALAAAGEGMDVLQSSDHDWLVDYKPVVYDLATRGLISSASLTTVIGDEISSNNYGHMHVFPLQYDTSRIDGGALDWTFSPYDTIGPEPDFEMSPRDIIDYFKSGKGGPGEKVLQVNHVADQTTGLTILSSWVTTTAYKEISPLSSYVDPSSQRIKPREPLSVIPIPFPHDDLVIADFTSIELSIGPELATNALKETGLPQWFNLLNLGILATGTADSDSHREIVDQLGTPRNYIASGVDPADEMGDFSQINQDDYARAINNHKVVVSAGPFIKITATTADGKLAEIGDTISSSEITLHIDVRSPSWAWFDRIDIFANTEPLPADDDGTSVFKGVASDPKSFFAPYHVPKFYYEPYQLFSLSDNSLKNWEEKDGVITAHIDLPMSFSEDTWIVVFVSGNKGTKGWRSMFPFITKSVDKPGNMPKPDPAWTFDSLTRDSHMNTSAWAFTNPIFVDVDGDSNGDGNPFEAKFIKSKVSPLAK